MKESARRTKQDDTTQIFLVMYTLFVVSLFSGLDNLSYTPINAYCMAVLRFSLEWLKKGCDRYQFDREFDTVQKVGSK